MGDKGGINFRRVEGGLGHGVALYRSADPNSFTALGARELHAKGKIRHVLDLRSASEVARYGKPALLVDAGIAWKHAPLTGYGSSHIEGDAVDVASYVAYYLEIFEKGAPCLVAIFRTIEEICHEPFLVCCHCGKDRTGIIVATLLCLLGAAKTDIARDFAASREPLLENADHFREKWLKRSQTKEEYVRRFMTKEETILSALAAVETRHGSIVGFLERKGLEMDVMRSIAEKMSHREGVTA